MALRRRRVSLFGALAVVGLSLSGCGGGARRPRTDVPEPAVSPPPGRPPAGRVTAVGGPAEGLALDPTTGLVAVAIQRPPAIAFVDPASGQVGNRVAIAGAARHLELAGPAMVLVPEEPTDTVLTMTIPTGTVLTKAPTGRQPHDVALLGHQVFAGDELGDTVHILEGATTVAVVSAPVQPGGLAASGDGSAVVVVGVRGRRIAAFGPGGRQLAAAACGVGPTHVRAGPGRLFFVADTEGGAVLVFRFAGAKLRQVATVAVGGAPYGLAWDAGHDRLYVTLTSSNTLVGLQFHGTKVTGRRHWPTVRQPNSVAAGGGRVIVASADDDALETISPAW